MTTSLKRDNHFLPVCYQKGFADSSGRVWVKYANRGNAVHCHPSRVGKERNLYIRTTGGVGDNKFEDFFSREVENDFARVSQRVKRERNHLSSVTGEELGAIGKFVASQAVRTLANKQSIGSQLGRAPSTNEFISQMAKQMKAVISNWATDHPSFDFYTSLPCVGEYFITGDDPVVLEVPKNDDRPGSLAGGPQRKIASVEAILRNPGASFGVALSPYVCAFLVCNGKGQVSLPPRTLDPERVARFNAFIRKQCNLFTLARDMDSLA